MDRLAEQVEQFQSVPTRQGFADGGELSIVARSARLSRHSVYASLRARSIGHHSGAARPRWTAGVLRRDLHCSTPAARWSNQAVAFSGVYDKSVALVLQPNELTDRGGNQQRTGNQVRLDLGDDLLGCLLIRVLLAGGDLTGLPMDCLMSYQEQSAAPLEALYAGVGVIRIGSIGRWLVDWRVLAGEPVGGAKVGSHGSARPAA